MKVFLADSACLRYTNILGAKYSVGAGKVGPRDFDHHDPDFKKRYPAPCNDNSIPVIGKGEAVIISRLDPDTYVGLRRMNGNALPDIDLLLLEKIDLGGKTVCPDRNDPTFSYLVGVEVLVRRSKFPRVEKDPIDVTGIVEEMMKKTSEEIINIGREEVMNSRSSSCLEVQEKNTGFWNIPSGQASSQARTYLNGMQIAVIYLQKEMQIVICSHPKSNYDFSDREIFGIKFAGSVHSSGTKRGVKYNAEKARRVFREIVNDTEKYMVISQGKRK